MFWLVIHGFIATNTKQGAVQYISSWWKTKCPNSEVVSNSCLLFGICHTYHLQTLYLPTRKLGYIHLICYTVCYHMFCRNIHVMRKIQYIFMVVPTVYCGNWAVSPLLWSEQNISITSGWRAMTFATYIHLRTFLIERHLQNFDLSHHFGLWTYTCKTTDIHFSISCMFSTK